MNSPTFNAKPLATIILKNETYDNRFKSLALTIFTNKIHAMLCNMSSLQYCQNIQDRQCEVSSLDSFQQQISDYAI